MHRVFVYGTLKKGQPNYSVMKGTEHGVGKFIAAGQTKQAFPLVIAGPFNIPYCVAKEGHGTPVRGELYEVDDKLLAFLDRMEDIPNHYQRLKRTVCLDDHNEGGGVSNQREVEAFMYQICNYKEFVLDLPHQQNYDSYGPHGLQYHPREIRDKTRTYREIQNT